MSEPWRAPSGLPLGDEVNSFAAQRPQSVVLEGRFVNIAPLDPATHSKALYEGTHGEDEERIWAYMGDGPFENEAAFHRALTQKAESRDPLFFAILDRVSGAAAGYASYLRIEPSHRVIEIGNIVYTRALQQTPGATEAMYLMARHAFEELRYRRYEWKCNALHERSRRAAVRLGFTFEGVFRQHMMIKGRNRDTAWYAMLDTEWPRRRTRLERWLAPANFDAGGRQKQALFEMPLD